MTDDTHGKDSACEFVACRHTAIVMTLHRLPRNTAKIGTSVHQESKPCENFFGEKRGHRQDRFADEEAANAQCGTGITKVMA
ncbi:hypothetical protein A0H81_11929 [Grifola frondosa]|uniref:Uncharacterized protein n=1 Tax=Grifola frondosa TaxID=5627 RepID=A0A1C7LUC8_GRIFR|nr:hypothetical protein A0H81_11929 [Grifola frondosa]